jgi:hypothetical protein
LYILCTIVSVARQLEKKQLESDISWNGGISKGTLFFSGPVRDFEAARAAIF